MDLTSTLINGFKALGPYGIIIIAIILGVIFFWAMHSIFRIGKSDRLVTIEQFKKDCRTHLDDASFSFIHWFGDESALVRKESGEHVVLSRGKDGQIVERPHGDPDPQD